MTFRIVIYKDAQKQLLSLPSPARHNIIEAIDSLTLAARPDGCKKLHGVELWRLRIGRYRIVYDIDDEARLITIVKIAKRREDTYK